MNNEERKIKGELGGMQTMLKAQRRVYRYLR